MDHSTIRRLAFIRYLYTTSISQSKAPIPLSCASILMMHDAVELFLQLATEHLNVGENRLNFMDYWSVLSKKLGRDLEQKESMRRLNNARVALKHHGTFPSQLDVESFRGSTTSFFNDNTPLVFGLPLSSVSLIEFVNPESSRIKLKETESDLLKMDTLSALDKIAIAFEEMIRDYETRKCDRSYNSPFYFGRDLRFLSSFFMGLNHGSLSSSNHKLGDFVDSVKESIEALQRAIKILALGLDYRKYSKFRRLTPNLTMLMSGEFVAHRKYSENNKPSVDDTRFCIDFVVESALVLAEFDYTMIQN
jgi:hypothetical protein